VSARRVPKTRSVVAVSAKRLRNGTLRAERVRVSAHRRHARLRGLVTWASKSRFTVASRGASLVVRKSSADGGEPVGTPVRTDVTIDDQGDLEEDDSTPTGSPPGQIELEGVVLSADTSNASDNTITISADDDQEEASAGASSDDSDDTGDDDGAAPAIVVHVPDATKFAVGDKVELIVSGPAADGSFTLVSVKEQEGQFGDDDGQNNDVNDGDVPGGDSSGPGGDD
jgi:hypothetical protein